MPEAPGRGPADRPDANGEAPTIELVERMVLELKNTSELMVDLALSAIIYYSEELAEEVRLLEDHMDMRTTDVQRHVLEVQGAGGMGTEQALALMRLSEATETIADAAREIADVVLRDVEPHPVLAQSVADSDVVFVRARVFDDGELAGETIGERSVHNETGMRIFAIRREGRWILGPGAGDVVEVGDVLLASGPEQGRERLLGLCGTQPQNEADWDEAWEAE